MPQAKRKSNRTHKKLRYQDLVSTGPGTLAGRFMRRFWHPIHRAEELRAGQAKPIEIMSERFTLYRGETARRMSSEFRCPHRGTQLSAGWVEGDSIRCMYHGWLFNGAGQCTDQPAEEKSFAAKIRIKKLPDSGISRFDLHLLRRRRSAAVSRSIRIWKRMACSKFCPPKCGRAIFFSASTTTATPITCPSFTAARTRLPPPIIAAACRRFPRKKAPGERRRYASFAQGWRNVFHFFMPNVYAFRNPSPEPECGSEDRMQWDVPLDDEHSLEFRLRRLPLSGEAADKYRARRDAAAAEPKISVAQMGEAVLSGKLSFQDLDNFFKDKISLVHTQDYVAQVGQGSLADRAARTSRPLRHRRHPVPQDLGTRAARLSRRTAAEKMGLATRRANKVPRGAGETCPEPARLRLGLDRKTNLKYS